MKADVDTSILNSVSIKRFTKSVLEAYGATIDRSDRAKWEVSFPDELAERLDRESGTLVFDPADREMGSGHLLVQPGTQTFSALLGLVEQSGSVGRLRLTEDDLQVNPPAVLRESDLTVEMAEFSEQTRDFALSFHFRVQFETPSSFHNEEMVTVTVDPETRSRLPDLTDRLTSHLPQLLEQRDEDAPPVVTEDEIQRAFQEAQRAVVDRSRSTVSEIREGAEASARERIEEISDWYERRREELDRELREQREEIQKWLKKRRKARKDSTRRTYSKNRRAAEEEYERLEAEIAEKKDELTREEAEDIDAVIDRNGVEVDVTLLGATEVEYARGSAAIQISSDFADAEVRISYSPATDEFQGLGCHVCSRDLTEGILPQLCANGHLVGDPCATTCRNCGVAHCDACGTETEYGECAICWEDVCHGCRSTCTVCGETVCADHSDECAACGGSTCRLCGEACSTCGVFHCDESLRHCPTCDSFHCTDHVLTCTRCETALCEEHIGVCDECGDPVCSEHSYACESCGETLCERHLEPCESCTDESGDGQRGYCSSHVVRCSVDDSVVCSNHREPRTIGSGFVCSDHRAPCETCSVEYGSDELTEGQCSACRSIGEVDEQLVPRAIADEFRTVSAGGNEAYLVILGKKLLGRNKVVVYDREAGEERDRHSAGLVKQLRGQY